MKPNYKSIVDIADNNISKKINLTMDDKIELEYDDKIVMNIVDLKEKERIMKSE